MISVPCQAVLDVHSPIQNMRKYAGGSRLVGLLGVITDYFCLPYPLGFSTDTYESQNCSLRRQDISTHDIGYVEWASSCLTLGRISNTCIMSMWRNDMKCEYMLFLKKIAHKGLTWTLPVPVLYITGPELGHQYAVYECSVANRPTGDYRIRKGFLHISDFRGNKDKETHHNIPF